MTTRTRFCLVLALVLFAGLAAGSVCVGAYPLSLGQIGQLLLGGLRDTMESRVFFTLRLPRTAMAVLAGLALGAAGQGPVCVMGSLYQVGEAYNCLHTRLFPQAQKN